MEPVFSPMAIKALEVVVVADLVANVAEEVVEMYRPGFTLKVFSLFSVIVFGSMSTHCSQEKNTLAEKETTAAPAEPVAKQFVTKAESLSLQEVLNNVCSKVAQVPIDDPLIKQDSDILCLGGKPSADMIQFASNPYEGVDEPTQFDPIFVTSANSVTEGVIAGAIRYPKTVQQIEALDDKTMTLAVTKNEVSMSAKIL